MTSSVLHLLANSPLTPNRSEPPRVETYANELISNIIKDASKSASQSHSIDTRDANELSRRRKSTEQVDHDGLEQKTTDLIHEIRSATVLPTADDQDEDLLRSLSESTITARPLSTKQPLPVCQDESLSESDDLDCTPSAPMNISGHSVDYLSEPENPTRYRLEDDHEFPERKTGTVYDHHPSLHATKQDNLDETRRFQPTSPTGRPSAISNQSTLPLLEEEQESSTSAKMSSSHPLDDPDHRNQADDVETRDSSQDVSLMTRPGSPTPDDSSKLSNDTHPDDANRPNLTVNKERNNSPVEPGDHQHNVSPSSRPGSHHSSRLLTPNQGPSRSPSGEQLQIPFSGFETERVNSPPPPPPTTGITSIIRFHPLLKKSCSDKEQDQTRSPSEMSRVSSPTSMASNEKVLEGATVTPHSRRESEVMEPTLQDSDTRQESSSQPPDELDHPQERRTDDRTSPESTSHREDHHTGQPDGSDDEKTVVHRKRSTTSDQHSSDHEENHSRNGQSPSSSRRQSAVEHDEQPKAVLANNDRRRSSSDNTAQRIIQHAASPNNESRTSAKHRALLPRRSGPQSKRTASLSTDKTAITPIASDSSKNRLQSRKHTSTTDSDIDRRSVSKLPSLASSSQREKPNRSQTSKKQSMPSLSNRSPIEDTFTADEHEVKRKSPTGKSNSQSREKDEQRRVSHRNLSANSSTHICLIDDKSLDSASDNNTKSSQHGQRTKVSRKNESIMITDPVNDVQGSHRASSSDELELTTHKPLKATKPMSEQLHSRRERARSTPPAPGAEKQSRDPMNVNITVVIKNASDDENVRLTTAEAFVDGERSGTSNSNRRNQRSKSVDQSTQSDTEAVVAEKHSRLKHISRTCQTYECVFRRIERERDHQLRARSATEHSIQTRKSQVRSRNKSPKKYLSPYLSADSFRMEEMLRKEYNQSRRNPFKSSTRARNVSPQGGKLLILRPTLPLHHTDAVGVQRIRLHYEIDLIPQNTTSTQRNQSTITKSGTPTINASSASARSTSQTAAVRRYQRKDNRTVKES